MANTTAKDQKKPAKKGQPMYPYVVLEQDEHDPGTFYVVGGPGDGGTVTAPNPAKAEEMTFRQLRAERAEEKDVAGRSVGKLLAILAKNFQPSEYEAEVNVSIKRKA